MRRLRPLSEAECYARCYGEWEATVTIVRLEPRHEAGRGPLARRGLRRGLVSLQPPRERVREPARRNLAGDCFQLGFVLDLARRADRIYRLGEGRAGEVGPSGEAVSGLPA